MGGRWWYDIVGRDSCYPFCVFDIDAKCETIIDEQIWFYPLHITGAPANRISGPGEELWGGLVPAESSERLPGPRVAVDGRT